MACLHTWYIVFDWPSSAAQDADKSSVFFTFCSIIYWLSLLTFLLVYCLTHCQQHQVQEVKDISTLNLTVPHFKGVSIVPQQQREPHLVLPQKYLPSASSYHTDAQSTKDFSSLHLLPKASQLWLPLRNVVQPGCSSSGFRHIEGRACRFIQGLHNQSCAWSTVIIYNSGKFWVPLSRR